MECYQQADELTTEAMSQPNETIRIQSARTQKKRTPDSGQQKAPTMQSIAGAALKKSGRLDLNQRPPAPEAGALPGYATPRM
jgi:hypothetical protein